MIIVWGVVLLLCIYIYPLGNGGYHNGTPYQPTVHCFISTKAEVRLSSTMTLRERTPDVWRHRRAFHQGIGDALQPKTFQRLNLRCESLSVSNPHLGVRVIYLSIYLSSYLPMHTHTHTWILVSWHLEWYPVGRQDAYTMQKKALGEGSFGSAFRATCKSSRPVAMMFPLFYPG